MIYTLTLNPALDRFIVIDKLMDEDTIRVIEEKFYAAGKGIDVSRVIRELGGESVVLGLLGGYDGLNLEGLLINAGVITDFTKISQETRTNIIIKERSSGRQFVISAKGPEVTAAEVGQIYNHVQSIRGMDYLVMSGSLPRGVTANLYGQLILAAKKQRALVFLDTDGIALKESVNYQPSGIKPNLFELSRLVNRELKNEKDIIVACEEIHQKAVPYILVSRGKDGLILSTKEQIIMAKAPAIKVGSTVGAGDSTLAGFILAHSQGKDLSECVRLACAAGTATAMTPGTELCHKEDLEKILTEVEISYL